MRNICIQYKTESRDSDDPVDDLDFEFDIFISKKVADSNRPNTQISIFSFHISIIIGNRIPSINLLWSNWSLFFIPQLLLTFKEFFIVKS